MLDDNDKKVIASIVREVINEGIRKDVEELKFHQQVTDQKYDLLMKDINNYHNSNNGCIKETDFMRRLKDGSCVL